MAKRSVKAIFDEMGVVMEHIIATRTKYKEDMDKLWKICQDNSNTELGRINALAVYENAKADMKEEKQIFRDNMLIKLAEIRAEFNAYIEEVNGVKTADLDGDFMTLLNHGILSLKEVEQYAQTHPNNRAMARVLEKWRTENNFTSDIIHGCYLDNESRAERCEKTFNRFAEVVKGLAQTEDEIAIKAYNRPNIGERYATDYGQEVCEILGESTGTDGVTE